MLQTLMNFFGPAAVASITHFAIMALMAFTTHRLLARRVPRWVEGAAFIGSSLFFGGLLIALMSYVGWL